LGKRAGLNSPPAKAEALAEAKAWLRSAEAREAEQALAALPPGRAWGARPPRPGRPCIPMRIQPTGPDSSWSAHPTETTTFALLCVHENAAAAHSKSESNPTIRILFAPSRGITLCGLAPIDSDENPDVRARLWRRPRLLSIGGCDAPRRLRPGLASGALPRLSAPT